jgi:hypothetical protein
MAEKLLEQLELVDVVFEDNKKVVLVFLDGERGEIREVNFNKQVYNQDTKKFVDDDEKAKKVEEWAEEYFGLEFDRLAEAIGERKDVYCYDNFNSLFPVQMVTKFEEDMLGQMLYVDCVNAFNDGKKLAIHFEYEGELYESKMQYADYVEARKEWFINPIKQKKQYDKFKEKFQIDVENIAELIGKQITVEVKKAMGKYIYSEVKPFAKPKKGKGA